MLSDKNIGNFPHDDNIDFECRKSQYENKVTA